MPIALLVGSAALGNAAGHEPNAVWIMVAVGAGTIALTCVHWIYNGIMKRPDPEHPA